MQLDTLTTLDEVTESFSLRAQKTSQQTQASCVANTCCLLRNNNIGPQR